jgi:hypothetical protein
MLKLSGLRGPTRELVEVNRCSRPEEASASQIFLYLKLFNQPNEAQQKILFEYDFERSRGEGIMKN